MSRPSKRDDVLRAAQRCFYAHGIAATGVDAIAEEAGVSKRTLYNHFPSKDDLLAHYIAWREERWRSRLDAAREGVTDPVEQILVYFDAYTSDVDDDGYRGCAYINAAAELAGDSPALAEIVASKARVRAELQDLLGQGGHPDPPTAAVTISTLLEGTCAVGGIRRSTDEVPLVKEAARALAQAGLATP